jgi:hypothetical protein
MLSFWFFFDCWNRYNHYVIFFKLINYICAYQIWHLKHWDVYLSYMIKLCTYLIIKFDINKWVMNIDVILGYFAGLLNAFTYILFYLYIYFYFIKNFFNILKYWNIIIQIMIVLYDSYISRMRQFAKDVIILWIHELF